MCDPETGKVTGIIDWEGTCIVPRAVGYASVPIFMRQDWTIPRPAPSEIATSNETRLFYATALYPHTPDAQHTFRSPVTNALHNALFPQAHRYSQALDEVAVRILTEIFPAEDAVGICLAVGDLTGGRGAVDEGLLVQGLEEILKPLEVVGG